MISKINKKVTLFFYFLLKQFLTVSSSTLLKNSSLLVNSVCNNDEDCFNNGTCEYSFDNNKICHCETQFFGLNCEHVSNVLL